MMPIYRDMFMQVRTVFGISRTANEAGIQTHMGGADVCQQGLSQTGSDFSIEEIPRMKDPSEQRGKDVGSGLSASGVVT